MSRALSQRVGSRTNHFQCDQLASHTLHDSCFNPSALTFVIHQRLSFTRIIMTGNGSSQIDKGKGRAIERSENQSASVEPIPSSIDKSNIATYMASLSMEQRDTISEFVEATK